MELHVSRSKRAIKLHRPPQHRLSDLLKRVSKRNIHPEFKTGRPVGKEAL